MQVRHVPFAHVSEQHCEPMVQAPPVAVQLSQTLLRQRLVQHCASLPQPVLPTGRHVVC